MKNIETKIIEYVNAGYLDKKPRLTTPQVVEYANTVGAEWRVENEESEKKVTCSGMRYSTGGGSRTYKGYRVYKGSHCIFNSTETYRTIGDLLRELPNYSTLSN